MTDSILGVATAVAEQLLLMALAITVNYHTSVEVGQQPVKDSN